MPRLENWTIMNRTDLNGRAYQKLVGNVFGHPKANWNRMDLVDGHNIMTSRIVSLDLEKGIAVTESGTVYELGVKSDVEI